MKIAVQGLGKMGMQIARKLTEAGHTVFGMDLNPAAISEATEAGITCFDSKEALAAAFDGEAVTIWMMLAADIVDTQASQWLALIPKESILIDGGNSNFESTKNLNTIVAAAGSGLVDVGTSGGVWGYDNGFSMMVGADKRELYEALKPALSSLSAPSGGHKYFGPSGSGHYVKMVHNAIEYGMMESLAEGYRMLHEGPYDSISAADAGEIWQQHSVITSWLNDLTQQVVTENPTLEGIDGFVTENGEARWTLDVANKLGIQLPAIQAAIDVRIASQHGNTNYATKLIAAMRNKFGGHAING